MTDAGQFQQVCPAATHFATIRNQQHPPNHSPDLPLTDSTNLIY
jgi:hypothetical protein